MGTVRLLFLPKYKIQPFEIALPQLLEALVQLIEYRMVF